MPVVYCKVQHLLCQLCEPKSIFVFFPFANEGSTAHVLQANFGDWLAILDARWQQNRLIDAVIPDPKIVPSGWLPASIGVKSRTPGLGGGAVAGRSHLPVVLQEDGA